MELGIKNFLTYRQINEALKPSQFRKYMNLETEAIYKDKLSDVFPKKKRIYIDFIDFDYEQVLEWSDEYPKIKDILEQKGYDIVDYIQNKAKKKGQDNNITKITKVLSDQNQIKLYEHDWVVKKFLKGKSKDSSFKTCIALSIHPYDIAGMSTDRGWTSCTNIVNGSFANRVIDSIKEGTIIAYLVFEDDKNIKNPISRIVLNTYISKENNVIWIPENVCYGVSINNSDLEVSFNSTLFVWANENLNNVKVSPEELFIKNDMVYDDDKVIGYRKDEKSDSWISINDEYKNMLFWKVYGGSWNIKEEGTSINYKNDYVSEFISEIQIETDGTNLVMDGVYLDMEIDSEYCRPQTLNLKEHIIRLNNDNEYFKNFWKRVRKYAISKDLFLKNGDVLFNKIKKIRHESIYSNVEVLYKLFIDYVEYTNDVKYRSSTLDRYFPGHSGNVDLDLKYRNKDKMIEYIEIFDDYFRENSNVIKTKEMISFYKKYSPSEYKSIEDIKSDNIIMNLSFVFDNYTLLYAGDESTGIKEVPLFRVMQKFPPHVYMSIGISSLPESGVPIYTNVTLRTNV